MQCEKMLGDSMTTATAATQHTTQKMTRIRLRPLAVHRANMGTSRHDTMLVKTPFPTTCGKLKSTSSTVFEITDLQGRRGESRLDGAKRGGGLAKFQPARLVRSGLQWHVAIKIGGAAVQEGSATLTAPSTRRQSNIKT